MKTFTTTLTLAAALLAALPPAHPAAAPAGGGGDEDPKTLGPRSVVALLDRTRTDDTLFAWRQADQVEYALDKDDQLTVRYGEAIRITTQYSYMYFYDRDAGAAGAAGMFGPGAGARGAAGGVVGPASPGVPLSRFFPGGGGIVPNPEPDPKPDPDPRPDPDPDPKPVPGPFPRIIIVIDDRDKDGDEEVVYDDNQPDAFGGGGPGDEDVPWGSTTPPTRPNLCPVVLVTKNLPGCDEEHACGGCGPAHGGCGVNYFDRLYINSILAQLSAKRGSGVDAADAHYAGTVVVMNNQHSGGPNTTCVDVPFDIMIQANVHRAGNFIVRCPATLRICRPVCRCKDPTEPGESEIQITTVPEAIDPRWKNPCDRISPIVTPQDQLDDAATQSLPRNNADIVIGTLGAMGALNTR